MIVPMRFPLVVAMFVLLVGCQDSSTNRYASRSQVGAQDAFDRGWIPEFVPANASNIIEAHDIDSNHVRVEFSIPSDEKDLLVDGANFVLLPEDAVSKVTASIDIPRWSTIGNRNLMPVAKCDGDRGVGLGLINTETGRVHYFEPAHLPEVCSEVYKLD